MADQNQGDRNSSGTVPRSDDEPDPNVQPPRLVWILKSYNPGKRTRDGEQDAENKH